MKTSIVAWSMSFSFSALFAFGAVAAPLDDPSPPAGKTTAPTPLDRFKALEGTWDCDMDGDGQTDSQISYEVIARGSVVAEKLMAGTPDEMLTMYHMDGPRLMCTHYCAAQNQPRLEAKSITDGEVVFEAFDATNLASPDALHMNGVTFTFTDANHVTSRWSSRQNGQSAGHAVFAMTRQGAAFTPATGAASSEPQKDGAPMPETLSNFVILMYEDNNAFASLPKDRQDELMSKYMAWVGDLQSKGIFQSGSPCGSSQVLLTATDSSIRVEKHAPTKDVLTGLFIIRAASLYAAVEIAKTCPALTHGERIVVRPASHE